MFRTSFVFAVLCLLFTAVAFGDEAKILLYEESDQGLYGTVLRAGGNGNLVWLVQDDNGLSRADLFRLVPGQPIRIKLAYLEPGFRPSREVIARAKAIFEEVPPSDFSGADEQGFWDSKKTSSHAPVVVQAEPTAVTPQSVPAPLVTPQPEPTSQIVVPAPRPRSISRYSTRPDPPAENNQGVMMFMLLMVICPTSGFCWYMAVQDSAPMHAWVIKALGIIPASATTTAAEEESAATTVTYAGASAP